MGLAPKIPLAGAIVSTPFTIEAVPAGRTNGWTGAGGGSKVGGFMCCFITVFASGTWVWKTLGAAGAWITDATTPEVLFGTWLAGIGVSMLVSCVGFIITGSAAFFLGLTCINWHMGLRQPLGWFS